MNQSPEKSMRQGRILVVDDAPVIVKVFQFALERAGFAVRAAVSGEQALKEVEKFIPDAIILDLMLPGISGFEVLQQLRGDARHRSLKILVTSGFYFGNLQDELQNVLKFADRHCTKPVGPSVLIELLSELGVSPRIPVEGDGPC